MPCVLWIDEIEKGVAGDGGDSDGGVSRRVLGYLRRRVTRRRALRQQVATSYSTSSPSTFCHPRGSNPPRVARAPR